MVRRASFQKIKVFWPNVGSIADYPRSTVEILSHISESKPSRREAIRWICERYGVVPEFARKLLNVLHAAGVLGSDDRRYNLTVAGIEYLTKGDAQSLFRLFLQRVVGFQELFEVLEKEGPLSLRDLEQRWAQRMKPLLFAKNQCPIRYNWLRGFGYASVVAHQIFLSDKGLKLLSHARLREAPTEERRTEVSHADLEDKIKIIGEFFEFEAKKRPSLNDALPTYALKLREKGRQLDCLWVRYIPFAGRVKFPVEIQLGGNLADSLDRLETVSQYVQKAIIVTTEDQERIILDRLKVKKSPLLDKLTIVFVDDVYKAVEAASVLSALAKKLFTD